MPIERSTGTGSAIIASSAIATVVPLKTTAEPACSIARCTAVSLLTPPRWRSSRQRKTTSRA